MLKIDKSITIKSQCAAAIRVMKNKHSALEEIAREFFIGKEIRENRPKEVIKILEDDEQRTKIEEKFSKDICYYILGSKLESHWDDPRDWLEDIWAIYAKSRKKEYVNNLYLKTFDLAYSEEIANLVFDKSQSFKEVSNQPVNVYYQQPSDNLLMAKIKDKDLKNLVKKHIYENKDIDGGQSENSLLGKSIERRRLFQHNFIYNHGIYDTPHALVERTILLRALMLLNGVNPYGKRDEQMDEREQYAYLNPIKATIFGLHLVASRFRKTLFPGAQRHWGTDSYEFKIYARAVLKGIERLIDKLEYLTRLKNFKPGTEAQFEGRITLKVLAELRDISPIALSSQLSELGDNMSRKLLGLEIYKNDKQKTRALKKLGREKETFGTFDYSNVREYLIHNDKSTKVKGIFNPIEVNVLRDNQTDLLITDIFSY